MTLLEAQSLRVNFMKHPNTTLGAIVAKDITYLDWLASTPNLDFHLREAVGILCEHHGRKAKQVAARVDRRQGELF